MATTPANDPKGYYTVLDVARTVEGDGIKAAFRAKAKSLHPDHNRAPDAVEKFQKLNEAYQVLSDLRRRAAYDAECENWALPHGGGGASASPAAPPPRGAAQPQAKAPGVDFFACGRCGKVSAQPRYVVFERVRGVPFKATREPIAGVFCPSCAQRTAVEASYFTWLKGWWAVPLGPVYSLAALIRNLLGGHLPKDTNARILLHQARAFVARGDLDVARAIAEQARQFAIAPESARELSILLASLSTRPPRRLKMRWARVARAAALQLVPVAVVGAVVAGLFLMTGNGSWMGRPLETAEAARPAPPPPRPVSPPVRRGAYYVVSPRADVRDGPGPEHSSIGTLERFTTVEVLERQSDDDWLRIVAPGGVIGFVGGDVVAEGSGAAAQRQWCVANKGAPVGNGTILVKPPGGANRLLIRNTTDDDVVVKLKGADGKTRLAMYISAKETGQAGGVPDGTFQLVLATGGDFSRACGIFLNDMRTVVYPEARTFQTRVDGGRTIGATVALTLRPPGTNYKAAEPVPPARFAE